MRQRFHARETGASGNPVQVGFKRQPKQIVRHAQVSVGATRHRFRLHGAHFLRHHTDIGRVAAVVDETIIAKAVVEPSKQYNVVLKADV